MKTYLKDILETIVRLNEKEPHSILIIVGDTKASSIAATGSPELLVKSIISAMEDKGEFDKVIMNSVLDYLINHRDKRELFLSLLNKNTKHIN